MSEKSNKTIIRIGEKTTSRIPPEISFKKVDNHSIIQEKRIDLLTYKQALYVLLPNIMTCLMYTAINVIETHFVGQLNDIKMLDGISLGILYNSLFVYYVGVGLIASMNVTLPKLFGNRDLKIIGRQTNQIRIIIFTYFLLLTILTFSFSKNILLLLASSDNSYVEYAYQYVLYTIPALFFDLNFEIGAKYIEAHLIFKPVVISFVVGISTQILFCYLLIIHFNLGILGCGMAATLSQFSKCIPIYLYIFFYNNFPESNIGFNKEIFTDFWSFFKISVYSMITYVSENLGYAVSGIISNQLSNILLTKNIIISNVYLIDTSFSYGFMNSVIILASNYFGEKSVLNIKRSIRILAIIGIGTRIVLSVSIYFLRKFLFYFFLANESISNSDDMMNYYIWLLSAMNIVYSIQAFLLGILRGCDIIRFSSFICFIFHLIFLPILSVILALYCKMELTGIYLAEIIIYSLMSVIFLIYYYFFFNIESVLLEIKEDKNIQLANANTTNLKTLNEKRRNSAIIRNSVTLKALQLIKQRRNSII